MSENFDKKLHRLPSGDPEGMLTPEHVDHRTKNPHEQNLKQQQQLLLKQLDQQVQQDLNKHQHQLNLLQQQQLLLQRLHNQQYQDLMKPQHQHQLNMEHICDETSQMDLKDRYIRDEVQKADKTDANRCSSRSDEVNKTPYSNLQGHQGTCLDSVGMLEINTTQQSEMTSSSIPRIVTEYYDYDPLHGTTGLKGGMPKKSCKTCQGVTYWCEHCKTPCCTPCSQYDPDINDDPEFPKGRDGGIRNHPKCIFEAKNKKTQQDLKMTKHPKQGPKRKVGGQRENSMEEELMRLQSLKVSVDEIAKTAIQVAAHPAHRMIIRHGIPNLGNGNCAPEAANDNYNLRDELASFREHIFPTPNDLREAVVSEMIDNNDAFAFAGYTNHERWLEDLQQLRMSGDWTSFLADLMMPGIAYTLRKNILVINTKPRELSMEPITLILPDTFGRPANTDIPLLLAYNGSHYEGFLPETKEDVLRSVELVREMKSRTYTVKVSDVQCLRAALKKENERLGKSAFASPVKKKPKSQKKVSIQKNCDIIMKKSFQAQFSKCNFSDCHDDPDGANTSPLQDNETTIGKCSVDSDGSKVSEGIDDEFVRKCLHCKMTITTYIPHLKNEKNKDCLNFYIGKFDISGKSLKQKLEKLGKELKLEEQRRKRKNILYKDDMNKKRNKANQKKQANTMNSCKEFLDTVEIILSKKCFMCECFISVQCGKTTKDDSAFICNMCDKLENELQARWLSLGDDNEELNQAYERWASENFSTSKTLSNMKTAWITLEHPENVGILVFHEKEMDYIVAYPVLKQEGLELTTGSDNDLHETNEPTVLLAENLFYQDTNETISRVQAELASRSYHKHFVDYLSVLFKDRQGKIAYYKQEKIKSNQKIKKGKVDGMKITLKDETSLRGCLGKLKGTVDYIRSKRKEIVFSQLQIGTTNLKIFLKVFGGFSAIQSDPIMAMSFLRTKGYKFSSFVKRTESGKEEREYRVCCEDECDPFKCSLQEYHRTPLDVLSTNEEDIDPLTVSRFVSERVHAFVNRCIKPIAKDYCLFLMFNRPSQPDGDSSIFLCGHIWTKELSTYNYTNKDIPEQNIPDLIPEILRDHTMDLLHFSETGVQVVQDLVSWPEHLYSEEGENITNQTLERLKSTEQDNLRETSIFEAILCSARGMPISWSNLAFMHINTSNQREVSIIEKVYS